MISPRGEEFRSLTSTLSLFRERKFNTNFFVLKLFGHRRDILAKSRDIPPKKFDFPGFEGHAELFGTHPLTWRRPLPLEDKKFPDQKVWVWVPFSSLIFATKDIWACSAAISELVATTNFHGRSCSLIFRSRVGSLVSKKIPSPRFSPGSCPKAPASPPVLFVNAYQKPPVLPRFSSQMPPVLSVLPRFSPGSPPVLPRFSPHSTPTVKISRCHPQHGWGFRTQIGRKTDLFLCRFRDPSRL